MTCRVPSTSVTIPLNQGALLLCSTKSYSEDSESSSFEIKSHGLLYTHHSKRRSTRTHTSAFTGINMLILSSPSPTKKQKTNKQTNKQKISLVSKVTVTFCSFFLNRTFTRVLKFTLQNVPRGL